MKQGGRLWERVEEYYEVFSYLRRDYPKVCSILQMSVDVDQMTMLHPKCPKEKDASGYTLGERLNRYGQKLLSRWEHQLGQCCSLKGKISLTLPDNGFGARSLAVG